MGEKTVDQGWYLGGRNLSGSEVVESGAAEEAEDASSESPSTASGEDEAIDASL